MSSSESHATVQTKSDAFLERALAAWAAADATRALHPTDHALIEATAAARWLVLDLFAAPAIPRGGAPRDLFSACARLGGLYAAAGASPSLAAAAIDNAARALNDAGAPPDDSCVGPARSACFEGYVAVMRDAERAAALASWEYPACVVPLAGAGGGVEQVAIACGYPDGDAEALAAWGERVATQLVRAKVRSVILAGGEAARAELASAVDLVGIRVVDERTKTSWLPWKR